MNFSFIYVFITDKIPRNAFPMSLEMTKTVHNRLSLFPSLCVFVCKCVCVQICRLNIIWMPSFLAQIKKITAKKGSTHHPVEVPHHNNRLQMPRNASQNRLKTKQMPLSLYSSINVRLTFFCHVLQLTHSKVHASSDSNFRFALYDTFNVHATKFKLALPSLSLFCLLRPPPPYSLLFVLSIAAMI